MRRLYVIGFPLLMAFDTLAQLCFKYAGDAALPVEANTAWLLRVLSQPWVYGAILGYVGAFFTWMSLLRHRLENTIKHGIGSKRRKEEH